MKQGTDNIETSSLEWGLDLGLMSWNDAQVKIVELNKGLAEEGKPWRLPTIDELLTEFNKTGSTSNDFLGDFYWASAKNPIDKEPYTIDLSARGRTPNGSAPLHVRLVR